MKILYIIIGAFISLSCTNSAQDKPTAYKSSKENTGNFINTKQDPDSNKWRDSFLELKKAISAGDRNAVKSFIEFPIKNKGNEIWYVADSRLVKEISPKEIKPFTEADFDRYFNSIFAVDFRKTIRELNTEELFKTNKSISPEIEVVENSKSKLEASYDKTNHKLTLALITILTGLDNSTFTTYYEFDVLNNQQIKFREVHAE